MAESAYCDADTRITDDCPPPGPRQRRVPLKQGRVAHQLTPEEVSIQVAPHGANRLEHHDRTPNGASDGSHDELASSATDRDRVVDDLARTGLSQFYQRGVDSTYWTVFADSDHIRLAYMGTPTSNIAHLITLKRLANPTLHFPYPPIRPPRPWKPESVWGPLGNIDIANDAACFPSKEIRDALVEAFFEKIFPGFPVVEESMFRRQYADRNKPPPLILFQAVLLAGAHVCDHPTVASSRITVKRTLFRRASMLFHLRHENDRLHMAQAALLFAWHLENSDSVCGGSYYWLGIAQRIAFGMGMHRDLSLKASSRLPAWERRLYRRLWWTILQWEVFSCLEHGRPCMINLNDTDQPPLEIQDFAEGETEQVNQRVQFDYIMRNVRISLIGLRILQMNAPSIPPEEAASMGPSLETSLADFALDLSPMDNFWSCQLRIHYNLVLLHLHRTQSSINSPAPRLAGSHEICSDAAQAILSCLETIVHRGWTGQCPFTTVSAAMAAAIHMSLDARSSLSQGPSVIALNAQDRLARLLRCARELEGFWPSAGAVYRLFDELSEELKALARRSLHGSLGSSDVQQGHEIPLEWPWDHAIDPFSFAAPADLVPGEWMNDAAFLDSTFG